MKRARPILKKSTCSPSCCTRRLASSGEPTSRARISLSRGGIVLFGGSIMSLRNVRGEVELLAVIRQRCAGWPEDAGERERAPAQLEGHGPPVGQMLEVFESNRPADRDIDGAAEAARGFAKQERDPQRIAEMAGKLKAARVLAGKVDRHHRCASGPRQLGGEGV